jgi:hypothetical protein
LQKAPVSLFLLLSFFGMLVRWRCICRQAKLKKLALEGPGNTFLGTLPLASSLSLQFFVRCLQHIKCNQRSRVSASSRI